jgi:DNA-binding winged helix-turn-helix (wHTH) protein
MRLVFGRMALDTDARQLLDESGPAPLSPKAFELLSHLVENRPRALSKNELHERLWPGTYVSETNLPGLVAEIRRAIQDDPRSPRFLRTVHRYGYAFSGPVRADDSTPQCIAGPPRCWLVHGKRQIRLTEGENILGREPEAGGFASDTVSRRHARVIIEGSTASVEDLGSKNGTFLRGKRIEAREQLADGDAIRLGAVAVVFRAPSTERPTRTWKGRRARS